MSDIFYNDGYGATPSEVSAIRKITPFAEQGDITPYLFEQDFECLNDAYAPLALDTPHPTIANAYLVADGLNMIPGLGDTVRWTRRYAKVPAQRDDRQSISWTIPGLQFGGANPIFDVASVSVATVPDASYVSVTITTIADHNMDADDHVNFLYDQQNSIYQPEIFAVAKVQSVPAANKIVIFTYTQTILEGLKQIQKAAPWRNPITKTVPAKIVYDYFLPGVTPGIDAPSDIPILNPPSVTSLSNNQIIDPPQYGQLTDPSYSDYIAQITAKDDVVAQPSGLTRKWGNIYERTTVYVTAQ